MEAYLGKVMLTLVVAFSSLCIIHYSSVMDLIPGNLNLVRNEITSYGAQTIIFYIPVHADKKIKYI